MIIAGIGIRASATPKSLASAYDIACRTAGITAVDGLATATEKSTSTALNDFATRKSLPLQSVTVQGIETQTQSSRIQTLFGTGSVAEAAALAAAGPGARLVHSKRSGPDGMAVAALAETGAKGQA